MAATSDWRLYQLYMEFGEAQDQRGRSPEAADAYALALYYARRLNDAARIHECRQLVLERNPNHVAGQAVSAPLFFAQLLMRYPADEVELALTGGRSETSARVAVADEIPSAEARPERTFRQAHAAKPRFDHASMSRHHAEPSFDGYSTSHGRGEVDGDVLLADAGLLDDRDNGSKSAIPDLSAALKALAAGTIASGLLLVAYAGYSLYPMINKMNAQVREPEGSFVVTDDSDPPKPTEAASSSPIATPQSAPTIVVAKPAPIPEAGANTPVSIPDEPPPKVSALPAANSGDSSRQ